MYDLVVYGATGFTGKRVAAILKERVGGKYTYAIAGRNEAKLKKIKEDLGDEDMGVIIADGEKIETLLAMCAEAKVLLNCVGPYRYYGDDVVSSCVKNGTHYVDVTGEPEFMEKMEVKYFDAAQEAGCFVVTGCGFDSVPADMGTLFAQKQFTSPAICTMVEAHLSMKGSFKANFATYESAIQGIANVKKLRALRKEQNRAKPVIPGKKPGKPKRHYSKKAQAWLIPFPGSDPSVVKRSQAYFGENGVPACHFRSYVKVSSSANYYKTLVAGGLAGSLANFSWGRKMLLSYPESFTGGKVSKKGPSEEELASTSFKMEFYASGYSDPKLAETQEPDIQKKTLITGPEPGYVATPIILLWTAITILEDTEDIKSFVKSKGGVYTSASAFYQTKLVDKLSAEGITFEVIES